MKKKLKNTIRNIPDFPVPGILFRDITPVLSDSNLSAYIIDSISKKIRDQNIDLIAGVESRGFVFGMCLAQQLDAGFIPIRKAGKLPFERISESYSLEYGTSRLEMHLDAINPGERVHVHDDLLATGGTAEAVSRMIQRRGGVVHSYSFIIELADLEGRKRLIDYSENIESLVVYN